MWSPQSAIPGMRDAAKAWEQEYSASLTSLEFDRSNVNPCIFYIQAQNIRFVVHGDDFTVLGYPQQIEWLHKQVLRKYEISISGQICPGPKVNKVATIVNRVIEWTAEGIYYEPDARHVDILLKDLSIAQKQ